MSTNPTAGERARAAYEADVTARAEQLMRARGLSRAEARRTAAAAIDQERRAPTPTRAPTRVASVITSALSSLRRGGEHP